MICYKVKVKKTGSRSDGTKLNRSTFFSSGFSWFVLLLGSMFENLGKLVVVKHPLLDRSFLVHLINFIIGEPVSDGCQELPESVLVDHPNIVFIKTSKCILDNILGVCAL